MHLAYFDESGDDGYPSRSSELFVLTGVFLPIEAWRSCNQQLRDFRNDLAQRYGFPTQQEFHTREFLLDKNPYHGKYSPAQRRAILFDYVRFLATLPVQATSAIIDKAYLPPPPFAVLETAFQLAIARIIARIPAHEPLLILSDEGRVPAMTRVVRRLQAWEHGPAQLHSLAARLIEDVLPKTSAASLLVQVADTLAFLSFAYGLKYRQGNALGWANRLNAVLTSADVLALMQLAAPLWGKLATAENHFGLLPLE